MIRTISIHVLSGEEHQKEGRLGGFPSSHCPLIFPQDLIGLQFHQGYED